MRIQTGLPEFFSESPVAPPDTFVTRHPQPGNEGMDEIGQSNANCTDDNGCCDKGRTSAALQEGNLRSAYDMDDERLRQQGLYKPSGLEQRWIIPAVENVEHDKISSIVENRTDRPDEDQI